MIMTYTGLPAQLPGFLAELAANNERAWFQQHRDDYIALVREPLRALVAALAPVVLEIDPAFDVNPQGAAVSRINRDVRFSHDKSPYRITQWLCFKRPGEGWQEHPAYFLEIGPNGWRHGMGCYAIPPAANKAMRAVILARPGRYQEALEQAHDAGFGIEGDLYARPKLPDGLAPVLVEWLSRKSPFTVANRPLEPLLFSPDLIGELRQRWAALAPLYTLLR